MRAEIESSAGPSRRDSTVLNRFQSVLLKRCAGWLLIVTIVGSCPYLGVYLLYLPIGFIYYTYRNDWLDATLFHPIQSVWLLFFALFCYGVGVLIRRWELTSSNVVLLIMMLVGPGSIEAWLYHGMDLDSGWQELLMLMLILYCNLFVIAGITRGRMRF